MKLSSGENILYRAVAEIFNQPKITHKELTNKRASVALAEKIEGQVQVVAETGLLKWAFIPCFQQMFHDTNALPMGLRSNFQMVLDFLAYVHEAGILILDDFDDLCSLAVVRGGEPVPYKGTRRTRTLRLALREAVDKKKYNSALLAGKQVLKTLGRHNYLVQSGEGSSNDGDAVAKIDNILFAFREWMPEIKNYQDHHVVVDCFLRAIQDEGLEIVET